MQKFVFLSCLLSLYPQWSFAVWGTSGSVMSQEDLRQVRKELQQDEEENKKIQCAPPTIWTDHELDTGVRHKWSPAAPAYRMHCWGANLIGWHDHEGTKTSVVCKQLGYGSFEVVTGGKIQIACQCVDPQCNEAVIPVTSAFNNCKFRIKQLKGNGVKVTTQWQEVGNECLIFDETNNAVPTTRVVIECKKLSEPTEEEDF